MENGVGKQGPRFAFLATPQLNCVLSYANIAKHIVE